MRDFLYIIGLMAAICILAADFPVVIAKKGITESVRVPFASYVELPRSIHDAYLESTRTSWQVRNVARGRPTIGSLDSGVPLLMDALPSNEKVAFKRMKRPRFPVGSVDIDVYSLLPNSQAAESPEFCSRPQNAEPDNNENIVAFPKDEMLSIDKIRKLKEIMQ